MPRLLPVLLLAAGVARADEPVLTLPKEVRVPAATLGEVKAETAGKHVRWVVPAGLSTRPLDNGRTLLVTGPPGSYALWAYTAVGDVPSDPARTVVVIGGDPAPPRPEPADPLRGRMRAAFDADPAPPPAKREQARDLAELYRQAGKLCGDPAVLTSGDLLQRVKAAAVTLVGADALKDVRRVAAAEIAAVLATDAPLTDDQRTRAAAAFARLAETLDALGG